MYLPGVSETQAAGQATQHNQSRLATAFERVPQWLVRASAALGPIGVILGLIVGLQALLDLHGPYWAVALAVAVSCLLLLAIVMLYIEQYLRHDAIARKDAQCKAELDELRRDAQVAAALPAFHKALHILRDVSYLAESGQDPASYFELLRNSLASMNEVFHTVVGAPCRMCVKELVASADAPDDVTLRRDEDEHWFTVKTRYRHDGSLGGPKDAPTPLQINSDFRSVWHSRTRQCFFSNDLDAEPNYSNPHRTGNPEEFDYNATLVWPIQKRRSESEVDLIGYLCVDTKEKNRFKFQNDFDLGAAYADSLYTTLAICRKNEARRMTEMAEKS